MYSTVIYTVKVWLTAVIAAPLLIAGGGFIAYANWNEALFTAITGMLIGLAFSFPSAWLLGVSVHVVKKIIRFGPVNQKVVLSFISVGLTWLAMFLLDKNFNVEAFYWGFVYASLILMGIWAYRLEPVTHLAND